ncbi:nucleoside-diphosphate kinase [Mesorhizobium neociceri]|uniref:Nucleoside-diphosphate kinase n=1 Tax=Mesorhizobium neociceri TaxID=1307853 RepID=A0A838B6Q7_9HYPH|nr:nucleoside-diphosphate kinase [Mesorhizobium neociceri]MBA1142306.1 nucleoside-diphosphate kinase [Mesorhizobium neociceri]
MSSLALIVYGPEVARSGLTCLLDEYIRRRTDLELSERFFSVHSRKSIDAFYALTSSKGGRHWPLVLDLFDMRPVCATIWSGPDALHLSQKLKGSTQPAQALRGTVRSLFFCDNPVTNLLHVSDSHEVMDAELRILRRQSLGDQAAAWNSLDSGFIAHSSFQMLLNALGDGETARTLDNRNDGSAFAHAKFCYDRALLIASKPGLTAAVRRYFRGDRAGLEGLVRYAPVQSSWDRLILEAGLFSMPLWNCLLKRTVVALEQGETTKHGDRADRREDNDQTR